jgi:NAD(P)-dependent dehydrogenase (short-subunit alcohol dehydrogenase family)
VNLTYGKLLENKRVVLTGCVANIGLATAELFAANGASLLLVDRDPDVEKTARAVVDAGGKAEFAVADVSSSADVQEALRTADRVLGGVDVIVNNAGLQRAGSVTEFSEEDFQATMAVNVGSCFLFAKYGVPYLEAAGGGVIVNMASLAAIRGVPGLSGYCASKGAIVAFTRALAAELAPKGIRANALLPGFVDTAFNAPVITFMGGDAALEESISSGVPLGRQAVPAEMASAFLFLASDMSSYMTGQAMTVDGGMAS